MDAKDLKIEKILRDQRRFAIPIYQRRYAWTEKHLRDFWEDVVAKAEEIINENPKKFHHYMGALILAPGVDIVGEIPYSLVVDGQQRLTTFQLFLKALWIVADKNNLVHFEKKVRGYIFNQLPAEDQGSENRFKLTPTPADRKIFHDIMDNNFDSITSLYQQHFTSKHTIKKKDAPKNLSALFYFIEAIENYIKYGLLDEDDSYRDESTSESLWEKRLMALLDSILNCLKLVAITLDEDDDAQVIFETLNTKGEPLLATDLVKNNIFYRAEAQREDAERLFHEKWQDFEEPFWKNDDHKARPKRPRIDHFLSHIVTAHTGKFVSVKELYAEYRAFAGTKGHPRFNNIREELDAIIKFRDMYKTLETAQRNSPLDWLGKKLGVWEIFTSYPLAFFIEDSPMSDDEKFDLYRFIYSYIVRRTVCKLTPKAMNQTFPRIIAFMHKHGVSKNAFVEAFQSLQGPSSRFPPDDEFRSSIKNYPVYELARSDRLRDILWELERSLRTKYSEDLQPPSQLSIDHIMPQNWQQHWPLENNTAGGSVQHEPSTAAIIESRDHKIHVLGNLTLVTVPANSLKSNHSFDEAKLVYEKSLLELNKRICERQTWDEQAIDERGKELANLATGIWPFPYS